MAHHPTGNTGTWYISRVRRYLIAGIGPVTLAGTHFLISLAMLRLEEPAAFGVFTFLFVAAQFTVALSAAMFGAPLQALPNASWVQDKELPASAILSATGLAALLAIMLFGGLALAMGLPGPPAVCYGVYTGMMILRWVGRAWCYNEDQPLRTVASDVTYGAVGLAAFAFAVWFLPVSPESACYGALALASAASLLSLGRRYLRQLIVRPTRGAWAAYRSIWQRQSRWALIGVVTTEAAANVHVYLVTIFAGATAIAPLAAAALLLRPINVVQNALSDFERPQMARSLAARSEGDLLASMRLFQAVLIAIWGVSALVAVGIVRYHPDLIFSPQYDVDVVSFATVSWMVVSFIILLQVPANTMLQAAGDFRSLASATFTSSIINVTAVSLALVWLGPVWTVPALALGWLVDLVLVKRAANRRWRQIEAGMPACA